MDSMTNFGIASAGKGVRLGREYLVTTGDQCLKAAILRHFGENQCPAPHSS